MSGEEMARIKFGFATYNYPAPEILEMARTAESLGFTTFWVGEHYVVPKEYESKHPAALPHELALSSSHELWDPFPLLGAVSAATNRIKIGTSIVLPPPPNPLLPAPPRVT